MVRYRSRAMRHFTRHHSRSAFFSARAETQWPSRAANEPLSRAAARLADGEHN